MNNQAVITGLLLVALLFIQLQPVAAQNETPYDLINAVNALRSSYGLAPYHVDPWLMSYAQEHADYSAALDVSTHVHRDGKRAWDIGLKENIASGTIGFMTVAVVVYEGWASDWGHMRTMIGFVDGEVGAGMAYSDSGFVYYTLNVRAGAEVPTDEVGQLLATNIPYAPIIISTPDDSGVTTHVVGYGQTLWGIAATYGVTVDELRLLNAMADDSTLITAGQKLIIRKGSTSEPVNTTAESTNSPTMVATPVLHPILPSIKMTETATKFDIPRKYRGIGVMIGILVSIIGAVLILVFSNKKKKSNRDR